MKKKQLFALFGALLLSVSTAACGNSGTTAPAESSAVEEENTGAKDSASAEDEAAAKDSASADDDAAAKDSASADDNAAANDSGSAENDGASAVSGSTGEGTAENTESAAASDNDSAKSGSTDDSGFTPEDSQLSDDGSVIEFPEAGVTFTLPESFKNTKGFLPSGGGEIYTGDGVYCMYYNYVALTEADYENLLLKYRQDTDNTAKYEEFFNPRVLGVFSVYAADGNRSADDINEYLKKLSEESGNPGASENPMEGAQLIGTVGEYNFYFLDETQPDIEIAEEDSFLGDTFDLAGFREEYAAVVEDVKNACSSLMTFSEPARTVEFTEPGSSVSFSTVDLDGNPVTSEDLFSQNKITMVNLWGTYCGPCINEMPELEKLYAEFAQEGCGIIGVVGDAAGSDDEEIISEAKKILADAGVTYPNILPWDDLHEQLIYTAFPTTYFVDSRGNIVGSPVIGADPARYSSKLHAALEAIEQ